MVNADKAKARAKQQQRHLLVFKLGEAKREALKLGEKLLECLSSFPIGGSSTVAVEGSSASNGMDCRPSPVASKA